MPPEPGWTGRRRRERMAAAASAPRTTAPAPSSTRAAAQPRPVEQHPRYRLWQAAFDHGCELDTADALADLLGIEAAERTVREFGSRSGAQLEALRFWASRGIDADAHGDGVVRIP